MNSPQGTQFNTAATKGHTRGLPGGAGVQTLPAQCRRCGFNHRVVTDHAHTRHTLFASFVQHSHTSGE